MLSTFVSIPEYLGDAMVLHWTYYWPCEHNNNPLIQLSPLKGLFINSKKILNKTSTLLLSLQEQQTFKWYVNKHLNITGYTLLLPKKQWLHKWDGCLVGWHIWALIIIMYLSVQWGMGGVGGTSILHKRRDLYRSRFLAEGYNFGEINTILFLAHFTHTQRLFFLVFDIFTPQLTQNMLFEK